MNDVDLFVLVIVAVTVCVVVYSLGEARGDSDDTHNFATKPAISYKTGQPASPYYGSSNPINAYASQLQKTGAWNTHASGLVTIDDARTNLLKMQGVLNATEQAQHRLYYTSQVAKYPLQIAGDVHEMRTTRSPYVAGTRSLRAVNVGPWESQVPDKLERPIAPAQ